MGIDTHEWEDWDVALFKVGVALGLIPTPSPTDPDRWGGYKWVAWSANPTVEVLQGILDQMVVAGVLERREDPDTQYRRRPSWTLEEGSQTAPSTREQREVDLDLHAIRDRHLQLGKTMIQSFQTGDIEMDLADCVGEIELLRSLCALHTATYKVAREGRKSAQAEISLLHLKLEWAQDAKNGAYAERNKLVALVSKVFPSCLGRHEEADAGWDDDWRWIVYVTLPTGQCSWHIHDSDLPLFAHLRREDVTWDGHTTDEKYERLAAYRTP